MSSRFEDDQDVVLPEGVTGGDDGDTSGVVEGPGGLQAVLGLANLRRPSDSAV